MSQTQCPTISMIAAMTRNGIIGRDNDLPWKLKDDMARFKEMTTGHAIIMGRLTLASMDYKPLPKRRNIVVTRQQDFSCEGVEVVHSVSDAIQLCRDETDEIFIIGGASIYADAMPIADRMYITHIDAEIEGDAVFPWFDVRGWEVDVIEMAPADERNEYATSFVRYDRAIAKIRDPFEC